MKRKTQWCRIHKILRRSEKAKKEREKARKNRDVADGALSAAARTFFQLSSFSLF
jgi:hypothetical protein